MIGGVVLRREQLEGLLKAGLGATLLVGGGLGCTSDGPRETGGSGSGIGSISVSDTGTGNGADDATSGMDTENSGPPGGTDGSTATTDEETKFDLGVQPDHNLEEDEGCQKVDFVFVIDNSGSMGDDQVNLVNNFGAFITGIQNTLENVDDYQVGVVATDDYEFNIPACQVLGGLVVKTGGDDSSNALCGPYAEGGNYMTQLDDLPSKFACAAQLGTDGSGTELTMNAMEKAVSKAPEVQACNAGFLRDDALLVIVIITDEYDGPGDPEGGASSGDPNSWYNTVVTAKAGIPENVVVLSLINYQGGLCPPADTVYDGAHIKTFTEMFGVNGFLGGICEPDYGPIFMDATNVIKDACDNFMPPA